MKKNIFLALIVLMVGGHSCIACDLDNLDWRNIHLYSCSDLSFKKTKIKDFKYYTKGFKHSSNISKTKILAKKTPKGDYSNIRAGFENDKLDWIEFDFKKPIEIEEALYYFDNPTSISKDYNQEYDYYNYDYFTLTVDKKHKEVFSINLFDYNDLKVDLTRVSFKLPDLKHLEAFEGLSPGDVTEKDFIAQFPYVKPHKKTRYSPDSYYIIDSNLLIDNKEISKAKYVFKNGLLTFISLYPKETNFIEFQKQYGYPLKINTISNQFTNCQYDKFSVIIDKDNQIKNIGVFSSI